MPGGGTLTIETRNVHLDDEFARQHTTVQPRAACAAGRVATPAWAWTAEVLAHIFEPFFTTKDVGKGTGLGLATSTGSSSRTAAASGWSPSRAIGTTFRIYLPRAEAVRPASEASEPHAVEQPGGSETVMLVEDEALVRNLAADALRRHGYQVLSASTGLEALDLAGQVLHPIDVLVTDVVMPQMGGEQLAVADVVRAAHTQGAVHLGVRRRRRAPAWCAGHVHGPAAEALHSGATGAPRAGVARYRPRAQPCTLP